MILKVCYPREKAWPSGLRIGIAGGNSVPYFLGQTHYLVPYFTKIHFSHHVSQYFFFFQKILSLWKSSLEENGKEIIFLGSGESPIDSRRQHRFESGPRQHIFIAFARNVQQKNKTKLYFHCNFLHK